MKVEEMSPPMITHASGEYIPEFGARQGAARIDELHLVDDALVALATGDVKGGARGLGAGCGCGERISRGRQAIVGVLHFRADARGRSVRVAVSIIAARRVPGALARNRRRHRKIFQVKMSDAVAKL